MKYPVMTDDGENKINAVIGQGLVVVDMWVPEG